jgi:hypothetical protein
MKTMTASQLYKQRLRDLMAFGAILFAMGSVAIVTDHFYAAPKAGQVVREEVAQPKDGHSFYSVPPAARQTVSIEKDWPEPRTISVIKRKPAAF